MKSHTQIHPEIPQQKASAGAQRGYRSNIRPPAADIFLSVCLSVWLSACLSVNLSVFSSLCLSIRPKTSSLYVLSSLLPDRPYSCVTTPSRSTSGPARPSFIIPPLNSPPPFYLDYVCIT